MSEEVKPVPSELKAKNIGKVISVQVFKLEPNGDTIIGHTMQKHVGVLESFSFNRKYIGIKIRGLEFSMAPRKGYHIEVYAEG